MTRAISAAIVSSKKQAEEGKASIPSQLEANACYNAGNKRLDSDKDGIPCENLCSAR